MLGVAAAADRAQTGPGHLAGSVSGNCTVSVRTLTAVFDRGLALEARLAGETTDNDDNHDNDDSDDKDALAAGTSIFHQAVNDAEQTVLASANDCFEISDLTKLLLPWVIWFANRLLPGLNCGVVGL